MEYMNGSESPATSLMIGVAGIDITPPVGTTMVGYSPRKSVSIDHPLEAEALYCSDGTGEWLLVSADFIGIRRNQAVTLRHRIAEAADMNPGAVSICGTHTHSGPPVILAETEDLDKPDRLYLDQLWEKLTQVAVAAKQEAEPGIFEAASTEVAELGSNRRVQAADGSWTNEWRDPEGRHSGFFDPELLLVTVLRPGGRRDAAIVNYGVHPVVLGPESLALSPDYPGYLKEKLRSSLRLKTAIFLLGGAGNINPRHCIQVGAEHPQSIGERLASKVLDIRPTPVDAGKVRWSRVQWEITRDRDAYKRAGLKGHKKGDRIVTDVCAMAAGDLSVLTIPGELFSEYNSMIRAAGPTGITLITTLANDYIGYIPTDRAQEEGAYETKMAPAAHLEKDLLAHVKHAFAEL